MKTGFILSLIIIFVVLLDYIRVVYNSRKYTKSYNERAIQNINHRISDIRSSISSFEELCVGNRKSCMRDVIEAADFFIDSINFNSLDHDLYELQTKFLTSPCSKDLADKIDSLDEATSQIYHTISRFEFQLKSFVDSKKECLRILSEWIIICRSASVVSLTFEASPKLKRDLFLLTWQLRNIRNTSITDNFNWNACLAELRGFDKNFSDLRKTSDSSRDNADTRVTLEAMYHSAKESDCKTRLEHLTPENQCLIKQARELLRLIDQIGLKNPVHFQSIFCMLLDINSLFNMALLVDPNSEESKLFSNKEAEDDSAWQDFIDPHRLEADNIVPIEVDEKEGVHPEN